MGRNMINQKITAADCHPLQNKQYAFACISLLIILILIYYNSFQAGWQYDDNVNIVDNPNIHLKTLTWSGIRRSFSGINPGPALDNRPLSYLTFALNHAIGKLHVVGYHLVNFTIHYCTAMVLFLFILRTLQLPVHRGRYDGNAYSIALLSTFFWAAHPIQVTAVTYIVQRMTSMAALFYIMAMYCYLRGRSITLPTPKAFWFFLCGLSGLLSLASKENAAMLPVSLILYDLLLLRDKGRINAATVLKNLIAPFFAVAIIGFFFCDVHRILAAYHSRPFTLTQRLLTEPRVMLFYISLLLYPLNSRLSLLHDIDISITLWEPWTTLPAILICLGLAVASFFHHRKNPLIAYCILFFLLNHLIEGSLIPLELIYEHRNYLPSMLFFLPLVLFFMRWLEYVESNRAMTRLSCFGLAFLLFSQAHTVYMRNRLFQDETALWQDIAEKAPGLSTSHLNLGKCYWNSGFFQEAMEEYRTAALLNRFMHQDQYGMLYYNSGLYHAYCRKDYLAALRLFVKALETHSGHPQIWYEIIRSLAMRREYKQAATYADKALHHWPEHAGLLSVASVVFFQKGDMERALISAGKAVAENPHSIMALETMAEIFRKKGDLERSLSDWKRVVNLCPQDVRTILALIEVSSLLGNRALQDRWVHDLDNLTCARKPASPNKCIEIALQAADLSSYTPDTVVLAAAIRDSRSRIGIPSRKREYRPPGNIPLLGRY